MQTVTPGAPSRRRSRRRTPVGRMARLVLAAALTAAVIAPAAAARAPRAAASGHGIPAGARFYVPPPPSGAVQQIGGLLRSRDFRDAALLTRMELVPSAVWLDGETQAQEAMGAAGARQADIDVARQVRLALLGASFERAVPVFVAYNIPGRDCSQYSAGGAPTDAAYESWIDSLRAALGGAQAVVLLEPDALANLPGYCGSSYNASFPDITNTTRIDDVAYGVQALENDPNVSVYLDAGNSAWQAVGNIAQALVAAGVQQAQGFVLNISNYQYATNSAYYGSWVSSCIAYATQLGGETQASALSYAPSLTAADNNPSGAFAGCPNQYWNGGPANGWSGTAMSPYGVWSESQTSQPLNTAGIDSRYAQMLGGVGATTHFVIDTSRDGQGPDAMQAYAAAPYDQPAGVISTLQSGNWCNPPGSGLGTRPTADPAAITSSPDSYLPADSALLDADLWVKTPGQSDGQCDIAGGVRAWADYATAGAGGGDTPSIAGWPSASDSGWSTFDPLWSAQTGTLVTDPAAGAWFPQQALQLAQNAAPQLGH